MSRRSESSCFYHLGVQWSAIEKVASWNVMLVPGLVKNGDVLLLNGTSKCDLMDYEWEITSGKLYNSLRTGKWPS